MKRGAGLSSVLLALTLGLPSASALAAIPHVSGPGPVAPKAVGTDAKLDGTLRNLSAVQARRGDVRGAARTDDLQVSQGNVGVDVHVYGHAAQAAPQLKALGMDVTGTADRGPLPTVEGSVPIGALHAVAGLSITRDVIAISGVGVDNSPGPAWSSTDISSIQGVAAHNVAQARSQCNCNGAGVPVGVISDSMAHVNGGADFNASKAAGNLPPNVNILQDGAGADEGRAMGELIYDEVPGITNMFFNTGSGGPVEKANAIANLVNHGVKVIADDIYLLSEPMFQDGIVAQTVDSAAANGVAYYASAGNRARQAYQAQFSDNGGAFHTFGPGGAFPDEQTITTVPSGANLQVYLQWAEPWGSAGDSFTVQLYSDPTGANTLIAQSTNAAGLPLIHLGVTNGTGTDHQIGIAIHHDSGSGTPLLKYIATGNFGAFSIETDPTDTGALNPDAGSANGSVSVAAVDQATPGHNVPEDFSSRGPTVHVLDAAGNPIPTDVRQKPQIAGADDIRTDLAPGGLNPFFGTSAATPSIAGIAALALSATPTLNAGQLRAVTTNAANATACTPDASPPDINCGAGFLLADRAIAQAISLRPHPGKRCVVPKLKGKTLKKAKKALKKAHCRLGKVHGRHRKHGHVRKQKPKRGRKFPAGHKVNIWLR